MDDENRKVRVTCPVNGKAVTTGFSLADIKAQAASAPAHRIYEFTCPECGHPHRMTIQQLLSVIPKH